ncbi:MAG TPA: hypothetical protein VJJ46_13245 [Anaerolineales bacterium]|nr:hypothetical protein [Anaerolineales bacterium]
MYRQGLLSLCFDLFTGSQDDVKGGVHPHARRRLFPVNVTSYDWETLSQAPLTGRLGLRWHFGLRRGTVGLYGRGRR